MILRRLFSSKPKLEIMITNLGKETEEKSLGNFLNTFTKVTHIRFLKDKFGKANGIAFAKIQSESDLQQAISQPQRLFDQRMIKIQQSLTAEELKQKRLSQKNDPNYQLQLQKKKQAQKARLFIGNLQKQVTEEDIRTFFADINISKIDIRLNYKGQSRGFGFIQFESEQDMNLALEKNKDYLNGKQINLETIQSIRQ